MPSPRPGRPVRHAVVRHVGGPAAPEYTPIPGCVREPVARRSAPAAFDQGESVTGAAPHPHRRRSRMRRVRPGRVGGGLAHRYTPRVDLTEWADEDPGPARAGGPGRGQDHPRQSCRARRGDRGGRTNRRTGRGEVPSAARSRRLRSSFRDVNGRNFHPRCPAALQGRHTDRGSARNRSRNNR